MATNEQKFFSVEGPRWWGDYGDILIAGDCSRVGGTDEGMLQLFRTGPFIPPITFLLSAVVVTSDFKDRLADSGLGNFVFRPVAKTHIVKYEWEHWDRSTKPAEYPSTGEPEDYIHKRSHSPETAEEMGELWEVILPKDANTEYYDPCGKCQGQIIIDVDKWQGEKFFRSKDGFPCVVATVEARNWLEQGAGEWASFTPLLLERPASAEFYAIDGNKPAIENPKLEDLERLIFSLDDPARKQIRRGIELFHSSGWSITANRQGVVLIYNREVQHRLSRWMRDASREKQLELWSKFFRREWVGLMAENWILEGNPFARGPEGPGDIGDASK